MRHYTKLYLEVVHTKLYLEVVQRYQPCLAKWWLRAQGTEEWTTNLGYPITNDWRPWLTDARGENNTASAVTVGYTVQFGGDSKDFRFATVMGAGETHSRGKSIIIRANMTILYVEQATRSRRSNRFLRLQR